MGLGPAFAIATALYVRSIQRLLFQMFLNSSTITSQQWLGSMIPVQGCSALREILLLDSPAWSLKQWQGKDWYCHHHCNTLSLPLPLPLHWVFLIPLQVWNNGKVKIFIAIAIALVIVLTGTSCPSSLWSSTTLASIQALTKRSRELILILRT